MGFHGVSRYLLYFLAGGASREKQSLVCIFAGLDTFWPGIGILYIVHCNDSLIHSVASDFSISMLPKVV